MTDSALDLSEVGLNVRRLIDAARAVGAAVTLRFVLPNGIEVAGPPEEILERMAVAATDDGDGWQLVITSDNQPTIAVVDDGRG